MGKERAVERPPPLYHNAFRSDVAAVSAMEWFKLTVTGIIVIPLRLLLTILAVSLAYLVAALFSWDLTQEQLTLQRIPVWRLKVVRPIMHGLCRLLMVATGMWYITVKGKRASRQEAKICVCNHRSYFETFYFLSRGYAQLAKQEVIDLPFLTRPLNFLETLGVVRGVKDSGADLLNKLRERMNVNKSTDERLEPLPIVIYPEGTTTNGSFLAQFKSGAFQLGLPVQPIITRNHYVFFNPSPIVGTKMFNWRLFAQFAQFFELEYLPVYHPSPEERANPFLYAENVRKVMALALNQATSECSSDDVLLDVQAHDKFGLAPGTGIVEFGYFFHHFGLKFPQAKAALKVFHKYKLLSLPKDEETDKPPKLKNALGLTQAELEAGLKEDGVPAKGVAAFFQPQGRYTYERMSFRDFLYFLCTKQGPFAVLTERIEGWLPEQTDKRSSEREAKDTKAKDVVPEHPVALNEEAPADLTPQTSTNGKKTSKKKPKKSKQQS